MLNPHALAHLVTHPTDDHFATKRAKIFSPTNNFPNQLTIRKGFLYLSNIDKTNNTRQMKESFGEYIKRLRTGKGFTLTQLAAKIGIDSANLSKIENSKREFDEKRLNKLAKTFNLNIEELKEEFFSEKIAKKIYETNCSEKTLTLAEEKVKYMKAKNVKQGYLNL